MPIQSVINNIGVEPVKVEIKAAPDEELWVLPPTTEQTVEYKRRIQEIDESADDPSERYDFLAEVICNHFCDADGNLEFDGTDEDFAELKSLPEDILWQLFQVAFNYAVRELSIARAAKKK